MASPGHLDRRALEAQAARVAGPFSPDQFAALVGANVLGAALVFAGWWAASGLSSQRSQLAWLNLSIIGLVVGGCANGLWLARGRRAINLARAAVLPHPPRAGFGAPALSTNGHTRATANAPIAREGFAAAEKMTRYHRAECLLVAGKQVTIADRTAHLAAGRSPCEVCEP